MSDRACIALILSAVALLGGGLGYLSYRTETRYGPRVCGDVERRTPRGERAWVRECWRQK